MQPCRGCVFLVADLSIQSTALPSKPSLVLDVIRTATDAVQRSRAA
jgi:hypothetical protein